MKMFVWSSFVVLQFVALGHSLNVQGLVPSVFTPFNEDGAINVSVIPQYAQYLYKNNIDGVLVAGTASEGPSLSLEERKMLLEAWVKAARPLGLQVVMQVGGLPLPEVLELARHCERVRPDAILTLPELYFKPASVPALVSYVALVSAAAPTLPVLYYHHPSLSGVTLNMAKFFKEATKTIPNFKGIKCDFSAAVQIAAENTLRADQRIFMASYSTTAAAVSMGFNSSMTAISNMFPRLMTAIGCAARAGDTAAARELQHQLNREVAEITELGPYVPIVKAAMGLISGIDVGNTRDPLPRVSEETRDLLRRKLQHVDV